MRIYSGIYKNRIIQAPKGLKTRPTSGRLREALFNICQGYMEGSSFLDLFAGSGAMGIEAISRGAKSATFVDNSKESIRCINANVHLLNVGSQVEVLYGDVFEVLEKLSQRGRQFDIIYADPPYDQRSKVEDDKSSSYSDRVLSFLERFIDDGKSLLAPEGSLFLEDAHNALSESSLLKHFVCKSKRQMGRSALHHYIQKSKI